MERKQAAQRLPSGPEKPERNPLTVRGIIHDTVTTFHGKISHVIDGRSEYFHGDDAIREVLGRDTALSAYTAVFPDIVADTAITPAKLSETDRFGALFTDAYSWTEVARRINTLGHQEAELLYAEVLVEILERELENPENYESQDVFAKFQTERTRRLEEEEILHDH